MDDETEGSPLALQMAARVERIDPPEIEDILAAAGRAVIALLRDERSEPGGPWHEAVAAWNGARIRKLMRRGRGVAWERACELDGATAINGTAEVRAFVPGPMDAVPKVLANLQIQSSPLDEPGRVGELPARDTHVVGLRMGVAINPRVDMSWGKRAAQCAHAAQRTWEAGAPEQQEMWRAAGDRLFVIHPTEPLWAQLLLGDPTQIHDGGFTEIPGGTLTAIGFWN